MQIDNLAQIAEATNNEVKLESLGARFIREVQYGLGAPPLAGLVPPGGPMPRGPGGTMLPGGGPPRPMGPPQQPGMPFPGPGGPQRPPVPMNPQQQQMMMMRMQQQQQQQQQQAAMRGQQGVTQGPQPHHGAAGGMPMPQQLQLPPAPGSRPPTAGIATPVYGPGGPGPATAQGGPRPGTMAPGLGSPYGLGGYGPAPGGSPGPHSQGPAAYGYVTPPPSGRPVGPA